MSENDHKFTAEMMIASWVGGLLSGFVFSGIIYYVTTFTP